MDDVHLLLGLNALHFGKRREDGSILPYAGKFVLTPSTSESGGRENYTNKQTYRMS